MYYFDDPIFTVKIEDNSGVIDAWEVRINTEEDLLDFTVEMRDLCKKRENVK